MIYILSNISLNFLFFYILQVMAESPWVIKITWENCIVSNNHLTDCSFDLQISENQTNKYKTIFLN